MSLLSNFELAERRKRQLEGLPINPTGVVLEKIVSPTEALINGKLAILAGTNNYLGLTFNQECIQAGIKSLETQGTGTTGSRMANGTYSGHLELEREIAELYSMPYSMVFSTGYSANLGTMAALLDESNAVLIDSEAHASLFDGCRMSGAEVFRFKHNDPSSLEKRLQRLGERANSTLIIVEGLYSIRGDCAPLKEFAELKEIYNSYLLVDEAHSLGLYGRYGRGLADQLDILDKTDFVVGTFSKSLGTIGGFCVSKHPQLGLFKYSSRPYIFTASPSPAVIASTRSAIKLMKDGDHLRKNAWESARNLHKTLESIGLDLHPVPSPIIGVSFQSEEVAIQFWNILLESGIYTNLILPPAAPGGGAVIRCSVTAAHSTEQINKIGACFKSIAKELGLSKAA